MASIDGSQVLTAARIEIHLAGGASALNSMVGLAQRADISDNFNFQPIKGVGFAFTIDYVPGIYEGSGDLSTIRLRTASLSGTARREHESLVTAATQGGLELVLRSKSGTVVDTLHQVRFNNVRQSIDVGQQILMEDAQILFVREIGTA